jgi:arylsulfatase
MKSFLLPLLPCLSIGFGSPLAAEDGRQPNIIVILLDDMGFSDFGCTGSEVPTPHIDRLAANGVRFGQFYNCGRCCPTRASLLTGLYAPQTGVGHMTADWGLPGYRGALDKNCVTIAEVLKPEGYFTIATGKWHVGSGDGQRPAQRGFDRSYVVPEGGGFYYKLKKGRTIRLNDELVHDEDRPLPDGRYSTHEWTKWGLRFVEEALDINKPFFWYLAHNGPHFPLQAPEETIAKYRGKYRESWDGLRLDRNTNQLRNGIFQQPWPMSPPHDDIPYWDDLSEEDKDRCDHIMAIYAAVMEELDKSIGAIVKKLEERGALDNSLILLLSDNGASAEGGMLGTYKGSNPGDADSNVYAGTAWANFQNTPFRWFKRYVHEGGIATPLIAHWPRGIAEPGRTSWEPGHVMDVMATCLDITGLDYPKKHEGAAITPLEGKSFLPTLKGQEDPPGRPRRGTGGKRVQEDANQPRPRHKFLFWEHEGHRAVRSKDWKLVALQGEPWELYDLQEDRVELNNLAASNGPLVEDLKEAWEQWADRCNVIPWDQRPKK